MQKDYESKDVSDILKDIDDKVDIIFRYLMLFSLYRNVPRDYGDGLFINQVDAHTLNYIEEKPGIIAKEIAKLTYRTKGTVSIALSKLEELDLIEQRVNEKKKSERNIYLTERGRIFCQYHHEFDRKTTYNYILKLLEYCTPEEINAYFKVTHYRSNIFEDVVIKERKVYEQYKRSEKNENKNKDK